MANAIGQASSPLVIQLNCFGIYSHGVLRTLSMPLNEVPALFPISQIINISLKNRHTHTKTENTI